MKAHERVKLAFGKAVKKYRLKLGLSQDRLAERVGIHRTYMGDVERGERNVSVVNMVRIAEGLEVSLSALIREMEKYLAG